MWGLILCTAMAARSGCVEQRPILYPSLLFCERAAVLAKRRKDVKQLYCRSVPR